MTLQNVRQAVNPSNLVNVPAIVSDYAARGGVSLPLPPSHSLSFKHTLSVSLQKHVCLYVCMCVCVYIHVYVYR